MLHMYAGLLPANIPVIIDFYRSSDLAVVIVSRALTVTEAIGEVGSALMRLRAELDDGDGEP